MQFGEDPSISHVANRFMGTGLLRAPLPGKLSRPLLSAMVRDSPTLELRGLFLQTGAALQCLGCGCASAKLSGHTLTVTRSGPRRTSSFLRPGWGRAARGGTAVESRAGANGESAELVVATTPLRRCEGWRESRCRTGEPREAAPGSAGAGTPHWFKKKKKCFQFRFSATKYPHGLI